MEFLVFGLKMILNYLKINILKHMTNKELSNIEIINKGYLWVNIPAIVVIITVWFMLTAYIEVNGKISAIIGGVIGWIYWEFTINRWIRWALRNDVSPDRLFKIGKMSLLLWNRRKIDTIVNQNNSK